MTKKIKFNIDINLKFVMILIFVLSLFFLSGCGNNKNNEIEVDSNEKSKILIGYSMDTLKEERWQKDRDIFVSECEKLGAKVLVQAANGDDKKQMEQVQKLISEGIDVLVIIPHNRSTAKSAIDLAKIYGIPVIAYDRLAEGDVDFYISFDNVEVGRLQAKYIIDVLGIKKGNFVYIGGAQTDNNSILFREGVMEILRKYPDINIIYDEYTEDWQPSEAKKHIEEAFLISNGKIDAIICANDGVASAVSAVLSEKQVNIPLTGMDAEIAAAQRIVDGKQSMTIYKNIQELAETAAEIAVSVANGKNIETDIFVENSMKKVPSILLEPIAVDINNIDEILINSGFHKERDVYRKYSD